MRRSSWQDSAVGETLSHIGEGERSDDEFWHRGGEREMMVLGRVLDLILEWIRANMFQIGQFWGRNPDPFELSWNGTRVERNFWGFRRRAAPKSNASPPRSPRRTQPPPSVEKLSEQHVFS